ncbi:type II secretion system minor pseudopilin GspJ [Psychrobium sp. 1_MG-2023]|uniref:type II secretion system minor pseudopilin GspJ n=1 Tax=Psychrobium sp. 1_MG-2023 TaxID=3062624 RepID=UPI000C32A337|nr:type II secretion system minor pseudopilin GspJ [Psychrobium sp. 1_MG-2023]MDP2561937.1 type II secretion system minor pseudopilin GspJ [Psychrobium sp. 1_MG-2023]PKF58680.1 type II secretion system protein GspJ [Alteromonadales bacterium alter-6D02]
MMGTSRRKGFTLIEILIAIAIFSMIGLASSQVLSSVLRSNEASIKASQRITTMQRAYQIMQRDFMQMVARGNRVGGEEPNKTFLVAGERVIDSEDDGIVFSRLGWRNPAQLFPRGNVQAMGYRLRENKLERLYYLYPDPALGEEPQVSVILDDVEGLKFQYYDNNKWLKKWDKQALPQGVKVIFTTERFGQVQWQFLVTGGHDV